MQYLTEWWKDLSYANKEGVLGTWILVLTLILVWGASRVTKRGPVVVTRRGAEARIVGNAVADALEILQLRGQLSAKQANYWQSEFARWFRYKHPDLALDLKPQPKEKLPRGLIEYVKSRVRRQLRDTGWTGVVPLPDTTNGKEMKAIDKLKLMSYHKPK